MNTQFYYKHALDARLSDVEGLLNKLLEERLIEERSLRGNVLDIGVGYGSSYSALRKFSSNVTGVEQDNELGEMLVDSGVVDRNRLVTSPPLEYLKSQANGDFDFIAGLLLSHKDYQQIERLYVESLRLLKTGGQALFSIEKYAGFPKHTERMKQMLKMENSRQVNSGILDLKDLDGVGQDNFAFIATKLR